MAIVRMFSFKLTSVRIGLFTMYFKSDCLGMSEQLSLCQRQGGSLQFSSSLISWHLVSRDGLAPIFAVAKSNKGLVCVAVTTGSGDSLSSLFSVNTTPARGIVDIFCTSSSSVLVRSSISDPRDISKKSSSWSAKKIVLSILKLKRDSI